MMITKYFSQYFRPCIDIHRGQVKQIIGSTLSSKVEENYVANQDTGYFADHYARYHLSGGHVIMLDQEESTRTEAMKVMVTYPGIYQVGGGMDPADPAKGKNWLDGGAQKLILSSYFFPEGHFREDRLEKAARAWGQSRLVVDLSSLTVDGGYRVAIHGWKTITDFVLTPENLSRIGNYSEEILIHAIDQEGKREGFDGKLFSLLEESCPVPFVYAGGIHSLEEVRMISQRSQRSGGKIGFTIGSSLDLFGGDISLEKVLEITACYGVDNLDAI